MATRMVSISLMILLPLLAIPCRAADDGAKALEALQALRSATQVGLSYRDYGARLIDTKIVVDRYLRANPQRSLFLSQLDLVMLEYELARTMWTITIYVPRERREQSTIDGLAKIACVRDRLHPLMQTAAAQGIAEAQRLRREEEARAQQAEADLAKRFGHPTSVARFGVFSDSTWGSIYFWGAFDANVVGIIWSCAAQQLSIAEEISRLH